MLGEEWPDDIPKSYQDLYGLKNLRDQEGLVVDSGVQTQARLFAEETIRDVETRIFTFHSL